MKKKIFLAIAIVAMLMCAFAISISAVDYVDENGIKYSTTSGTTAKVADSRSTLKGTKAIIAETITIDGKEYTVTAVDHNVFSGIATLETIYFPPTITTFGNQTFSNCQGLTSIYVDFSNVVSIGSLGFTTGTNQNSCDNVKTDIALYAPSEYGKEAPVQMTTANFKSITNFGWASCQGLNVENVIVGESLTYLQRQVFRASTMKTFVLESENLTRIDHYSVAQCTNLKKITIKSRNLDRIENNVFIKDKNVESISIDLSRCTYIDENAFTFAEQYDSGNKITQWYNLEGKKVVNLYNVKTLRGTGRSGAFASSNLGSAETIIWPQEITSFEGQVFRRANLKSIYLNASADKSFSIDYYALHECPLTKVVIGNGFKVNFQLTEQCTVVLLADTTTISRSDVFKQAGSKLYYVALDGNTSLPNCEMIQITDATFNSSICGFDCTVTHASGTNETVFKSVHTYGEGVVNEAYCPIGAVVNYTCQLCSASKTEGEGTEHDYSKASISYKDGFMQKGIKTIMCSNPECSSKLEKTEEVSALFVCLGFSTTEFGNLGVVQGFKINKEALNDYLVYYPEFSYGVVVSTLANPLDENGNAINANRTITYDFTNKGFMVFEVKLTGIKGYENEGVVCCGYVVNGENESLCYLDDGETKTDVALKSYNQLVAEGK